MTKVSEVLFLNAAFDAMVCPGIVSMTVGNGCGRQLMAINRKFVSGRVIYRKGYFTRILYRTLTITISTKVFSTVGVL